MKSSALLRSIIFIPLFPLFLTSTSAEAMDDPDKKKDDSKTKRYFHTENHPPLQIIGTTDEARSGEENPPTSNTNSTDDSLDGSELEEQIYTSKGRRKKPLERAKSAGNSIKGSITSRTFSRKGKGTGKEEKKPEPEKQIILDNSLETSVPEIPQTRENQRQRSWGKNPHVVEHTNQAPASSPPLLRNPPTTNLSDVNAQERQDEFLSSEDLSPRVPGNPRSWKKSSQGTDNPLEVGLSLHLNENGQPLPHQPTSPRYQPPTPRQVYHSKDEPGIELKVSPRNFLEGSSEDLQETDEHVFNPLDQESLEQSLFVVPYNVKRGNARFMKIIDNRLFGRDPRVVVGFGVFGSLAFAVFPPTGMTGVNVNVTGYYFDIPPGEWLSTTLVTTFMTTFTLALLREGYEWGQTIGSPVWRAIKACYSYCKGKKEPEEDLSTPLFGGGKYAWNIGYKKSFLHYGTNGFALIAALPEGVLPAALLSLVWAKYYESWIIPVGGLLFVRYAGQAYNANTRIVRYLFKDYINQEPDGQFIYTASDLKDSRIEEIFYSQNLHPEKIKKHKNLVRAAIEQSLRDGEEHDDVAKEKYQIINAERDRVRGLSIDEKKYFALSALMSRPKPDNRMMPKIDSCTPSLNCLKIQCQKGIGLIQKPIEILKIPLKALALVGAGMAIEQGLKIFCHYWLPNSPSTPLLAEVATGTLVTFYTIKELLHIAKAIKEYGAQKASLVPVPNFSLASFGAFVPAGFSSLVGVILGIQYVDDSESSQKWKALMVPYAVDTFLSGHSHFKNKLHDLQVASITTIPEYTKECVVEYTPQFIKKGVVCIKEGIVNLTPNRLKEFMSDSYTFLSEYTSPFYQGYWLWNWHHDLDKEVDENDAVTNASLYFTTQKDQPIDPDCDDDESSSSYRKNVDYHYNDESFDYSDH